MSPFQQFIFYGFVPIFSFFLLERFFFTYYFRKTERRKNFIRNTKFLHPNNISKFRYPMGFLCVAIYHYLSPELALFLWGASMISDLTDGTIARHYQMSTPQGASIDPLSDKLMLLPPLFYLVYLESVKYKLLKRAHSYSLLEINIADIIKAAVSGFIKLFPKLNFIQYSFLSSVSLKPFCGPTKAAACLRFLRKSIS